MPFSVLVTSHLTPPLWVRTLPSFPFPSFLTYILGDCCSGYWQVKNVQSWVLLNPFTPDPVQSTFCSTTPALSPLPRCQPCLWCHSCSRTAAWCSCSQQHCSSLEPGRPRPSPPIQESARQNTEGDEDREERGEGVTVAAMYFTPHINICFCFPQIFGFHPTGQTCWDIRTKEEQRTDVLVCTMIIKEMIRSQEVRQGNTNSSVCDDFSFFLDRSHLEG